MADEYEVLEHSHGFTSTISKLPGSPPRVCKAFNPDCVATHFPVEREAYERFTAAGSARPASILAYYGVHASIPAGLVLEHAQGVNTWEQLWALRHSRQPLPSVDRVLRWAAQAAEALDFAHKLGVLNSDIHPINFFLDREGDLNVGDWAGASIDGGRSYSSYRVRYRLCRFDEQGVAKKAEIAVETEIFALGSALFWLGAGEELWWPELEDSRDKEEIRRRIAAREWPDVTGLGALGEVINACWEVRFRDMGEVRAAVEAVTKSDTSTNMATQSERTEIEVIP